MHILTPGAASKQDWATPPHIVAGLELALRTRFSCDVAASLGNQKCTVFLTETDDALSTKPWPEIPGGTSYWCNPPYEDPAAWIRAAEAQVEARDRLVVLLVPAATSTIWFHEACRKHRVLLYKGRIQFIDPSRPKVKRSTLSNCAVLVRPGSPGDRGIYPVFLSAKTGGWVT